VLQRTMERVFKALDLPRRSDIEALNQRLDRVVEAIESVEGSRRPPATARRRSKSGEPD